MTPGHRGPAGGVAAHPGHGPGAWTAEALLRWLAGVAALDPRPSAGTDWRPLADRCDALRVLPQMFLRLDAEGAAVPAGDAREYSQRRAGSLVRTSRALRGGCRVLGLLHAAGVAAAGFKGIAAVGWLHGGQPRRGVGDADIVVPPSRGPDALGILRAAGFRPKVTGIGAEDIVRFSRHSPGSAGNESLSLVGDDGVEIDVHWRLGAFDVDAMIGDARPIRVLADDVPLVRPGMGLLLAAHHSLRNDFVPDECLRDLLDAAGWLRLVAADDVESAWTEAEARRTGLDAAIGAFAEILDANGIDPGRRPPPADAAARQLADLFREQCAEGGFNTDLVYLCSLGPGLAILRGLLAGGAGHLRAMRAMETANGEPQLGVGGRLRRLAVDAWASPRRRWRSLRTLARLKERACRAKG